ncbi:MAG: dephospho-CoA kinase [Salinivirgaceae bacterium]|jgi:dephospho-CoA kinase|nr:dephospho-CoA kinase [Salinivirgaceae bacterium]
MLILGLTGGIGAGKSFVASEFTNEGIPVYNSDERAKDLMVKDSAIRSELIRQFGNEVYQDGVLNKKLIAKNIFNDKQLINWINDLVHPAVKGDFEAWCAMQEAPFVIKETAILIESGAYKQCDKIIVVSAPLKTRINRVAERSNLTPDEVNSRIQNQLPEKERLKYADYVINNDGTKLVSDQVKNIMKQIIEIK